MPAQPLSIKLPLSAIPDMEPIRHDDTSLKWGANGELSPVDQQRILARLGAQDPLAEGLLECSCEDPFRPHGPLG